MRPLPYLMCLAVLAVVYSGCGDDTGQGYTPPVQDGHLLVSPSQVYVESRFPGVGEQEVTFANADTQRVDVTISGEGGLLVVTCPEVESVSANQGTARFTLEARAHTSCWIGALSTPTAGFYSTDVDVVWVSEDGESGTIGLPLVSRTL